MGILARFVLVAVLVGLSPAASALDRVAVTFDVFGEAAALNGEQWINATRTNQGFSYGTGGIGGTAAGLFKLGDRWHLGPAFRLVGPYTAGNQNFGFGGLGELFALGQYTLPNVLWDIDAHFTSRAGVAVLMVGGGLLEEIERLQREGASVNAFPRVGWLVGAGLGARKPLSERLFLRLDLGVNYEGLSLFNHDETIDGLRLRKTWGTDQLRLTFSLGLEFGVF